jgi:hypothetical protein
MMRRRSCEAYREEGRDAMEGELGQMRWILAGLTVLLGIALMYWQSTKDVCSLYTEAPARAQDLYEGYKAFLNW